MFPGPYHSWFPTYSPSSIAEAHHLLNRLLTTLGPFDAIIGFSQGGNLTLSYLLQHAISKPNEPYPVDFAVIISSGLACSSSPDFTPALAGTWKVLADGGDFFDVVGRRDLAVPEREVVDDVSTTFGLWDGRSFKDKLPYHSENERDWPRPFHPGLLKERVKIPTVHLMGDKDKIRDMGDVMVGLCGQNLVRRVRHGGGHELPKKSDICREWVAAVRWAAQRGTKSRQEWEREMRIRELEKARREEEEDTDNWWYVMGDSTGK